MTDRGGAPSVVADDDTGSRDAATPALPLNLLGSVPAVVVVGGGLALAARAGATPLLVGVAIVQAIVAGAWVYGTGMPGRKGALVVAALAAGGADVTVSLWPRGRLGTELAVLGLAVPVIFVHQLARGTARRRIVASISAVAVLVVALVALPAYIQLRHEFGTDLGGRVVTATVAATAVALLAGYLIDLVVPLPRVDPAVRRGLLGVLGSVVVGAAVAYLLLRDETVFAHGRSLFVGAALGALAGFLAIAAAFVQHTATQPHGRPGRLLRPVLAAVLPLCVLAPAAFLLCLAVRR